MPTPELKILLDLGFIVITAAVFAFIGKGIRMPSLVGYIVAGMVLGPALQWVEIDHSLELISELGIALLLFLVGLELSLEKIRNLGRVGLILGSLQVTLTALGGFAIAHLLGMSSLAAIFIAATVTFSSTVVVIKLLDQKGEMRRLYARISVALFLAQDIVVIVALTLLSGLGGEHSFALGTLLKNLATAFGGMLILLLVVLIASRFILPRPFRWAAHSPDTLFIWALCWCFLIVLLAHEFHLSLEIGAFLAGIAIAQLPIHGDLHRRLHPLMTFFIAIFLVTLGIQMEFGDLATIWPLALCLCVFVLVIKPLIVFLILARMRFSEYTAFQAAVATAQVSEFSFILLALGASTGLIDGTIVSLGGLVGMLTIAASSYMIMYSERLYAAIQPTGLLKRMGAGQQEDAEMHSAWSNHIIVVGMNALGREIVQRLNQRKEPVLAIDTDPRKLKDLEPAGTLIGNVEYESVVDEIALHKARLVVSALQIEDVNHLLAYRCRHAGVPCAIHAFDVSVVEDLLDLGTAYLLMPAVDGVVGQRAVMQQKGVIQT